AWIDLVDVAGNPMAGVPGLHNVFVDLSGPEAVVRGTVARERDREMVQRLARGHFGEGFVDLVEVIGNPLAGVPGLGGVVVDLNGPQPVVRGSVTSELDYERVQRLAQGHFGEGGYVDLIDVTGSPMVAV